MTIPIKGVSTIQLTSEGLSMFTLSSHDQREHELDDCGRNEKNDEKHQKNAGQPWFGGLFAVNGLREFGCHLERCVC